MSTKDHALYEATAAATYRPNHFIMGFSSATPIVVQVGDTFTQNPQHHPLFVHEYWHYWHNLSTASGVTRFSTQHKLVSILSRTMVPHANGQSRGDALLTPDEISQGQQARDLASLLEGGRGPYPFDDNLESRTTLSRALPIPNMTDLKRKLEVWVDGEHEGRERTGIFSLGSIAIEESVVWNIEQQVRNKMGIPAEDPPPEWPYGSIELLLKHLGVREPTGYACAALGTLSLLTSHPGVALLKIAKDFVDMLPSVAGERERIADLAARVRPGLQEKYLPVALRILENIVQAYEGRGPGAAAVREVCESMERAIKQRVSDPLFDLGIMFDEYDHAGFQTMLASFPPPDAIQERPGDRDTATRDILWSFRSANVGTVFSPTDSYRVLQAQQDFLSAHRSDSGLFLDSSVVEAECPFFTSCGLSLRQANAEKCGKSPWQNLTLGAPMCWYAAGVASTFAQYVSVPRPRG